MQDTAVSTKPELNFLAEELTQFASIPLTLKNVRPVITILEPQNQRYLDVAGFILRRSLTSDRKFKLKLSGYPTLTF